MAQKGKHQRTDGRVERIVPESQIQLSRKLVQEFGDTISKLPDHAWKYGLTFGVAADRAHAVFTKLKNLDTFAFNMLIDVTAIDWLDKREPRFEVVYHLHSITYNTRLCIRIGADEEDPEVDSVMNLWPAADFLEREVFDMYGIKFRGHSDLRRILLYDEFVGFPLRKDYPLRGKQPRIPLRIPELRNTSEDLQRDELVSLPTRSRSTQQNQVS